MPEYPMPPASILLALKSGLVIPAHPLAIDNQRRFDERRQCALTRYYHAAGAGGVAVGVHSTQFIIHEPKCGLLRPVLELAAQTIRECDQAEGCQSVLIAGISGKTDQALIEARIAREAGYHLGLFSLGAYKDAGEEELVAHCRKVAEEIPLMGFYLQTAVGGRLLSEAFWGKFVEIPNVVAIKIAPFSRYLTLDVVRAGNERAGRGHCPVHRKRRSYLAGSVNRVCYSYPARNGMCADGWWIAWTLGLLDAKSPDDRRASKTCP
jgi:dihydrodipicolinate synthase/N-acetylneuraminate lyase